MNLDGLFSRGKLPSLAHDAFHWTLLFLKSGLHFPLFQTAKPPSSSCNPLTTFLSQELVILQEISSVNPFGEVPMPVSCLLLPTSADNNSTLEVRWARSSDDLLNAQKLRALAFGFSPPECPYGEIVPECDIFDAFARHLMVLDTRTGHCVGTYRLLGPEGARRAGGFYTESEFDISTISPFLAETAELGRSCVHPDYRKGSVIALLWAALARTLITEKIKYLMGCASVDLTNPDLDPDEIWSYLCRNGGGIHPYNVVPHRPFPSLTHLNGDGRAPALPPLLKGYLRIGARCIGYPAHDPVFRTADFPMWLSLSEMNGAYTRHFFRTGKKQP